MGLNQHWRSSKFYRWCYSRNKKEKWYDKIVEKVVRRLVENNLYVKPEKYKWKVREVGFLEVVIELENTGSDKRVGKLEIFIKECQVQVWGLDRP